MLACDSRRTTKHFKAKACKENFKTHNGPINFNLEEFFCLLNLKACAEAPYIRKAKIKF